MTETLPCVTEFVLNRSAETFPQSALREAARLMVDTIGIAIAAQPMQAGRIARDAACVMFNSSDPAMRARMMFDGREASIPGAAYALASQIDNLDGHDGFNPVKGHIGVVVLPTLLTLMQRCPEMSGPEALATVVVGYEVAGRAGLSLHGSVSDYHTSGAWNALGVVAMAARMNRGSAETLRQAFGIAEYHGPRSQMMREIANPTMLHDGSGWGALVGLSSWMLAENGFTGAPAITIEDAAVAAHWGDLGEDWQVERQYIKPYPICRWAHGSIDAVREIQLAQQLSPNEIKSVRLRSFHEAVCLYPGMPETTSQAQYSLGFAVANFLVHGQIGLAQISGAGLSDENVASMLSRIKVEEADEHNARFPSGRWADATIEATDGRILKSGDTAARGGIETPFTDAEIDEKYYSFANPVLGEARAKAIRDAILNLTRPESKLSDLAPLVFDAP